MGSEEARFEMCKPESLWKKVSQSSDVKQKVQFSSASVLIFLGLYGTTGVPRQKVKLLGRILVEEMALEVQSGLWVASLMSVHLSGQIPVLICQVLPVFNLYLRSSGPWCDN